MEKNRNYLVAIALSVVIVLACLTTAVGLMTACGEYFGELLGQPYRRVATLFVLANRRFLGGRK